MTLLPCTLVHHTGTMIRFRTSQLPLLWPADAEVRIVLPTGDEVRGHFRRNPANPNISGPAIVAFIKRRVTFAQPRPALIEQNDNGAWRLYTITAADDDVARNARVTRALARGQLDRTALERLTALGDRETEATARVRVYRRLIRPSALRRLVVALFGDTCQVDRCAASAEVRADWGDVGASSIVDVHHIEELARRVDHSPKNLCVLCGNHHKLVHGLGAWDIVHDGADVRLTRPEGDLVVKRDPALFA